MTRPQFLAYQSVAEVSNIIVDGRATGNTVLTLSHWPKSGTPSQLRADTSTEIVFNYLDSPKFSVHADAVSNDHFDEDGLIGIFALLEPGAADPHRDLLIDAAQAGDFGVFKTRQAARIAFTLAALADPGLSPLPRAIFEKPYPEVAGALYVQVLDILPRLLTGLDEYRSLWEDEDARLTSSETLMDSGLITIEEQPDLDLAVVHIPVDIDREAVHQYSLYRRTARTRLAVIQGARIELQYRYEGWVQMASRKPALRVDLSGLADELNGELNDARAGGGRWVFDGVESITPRLHLEGDATVSQNPDAVLKRIEERLRTGPAAWNPYD